ncbi:22664_t:CDS:1, partial [Gigaspora margarita]
KQCADNNRIFELKRRNMWKEKAKYKQVRYPGDKEKVQVFRREYFSKIKKKLQEKKGKRELSHSIREWKNRKQQCISKELR